MSFETLPDGMVGYASYELAELLARLTTRQRDAIGRIVQHVYIANRPWAELFRGEDRICPEAAYYRRGVVDERSGARKGCGWGHDPKFKAALDHAVKLALAAQQRQRLGRLQRAKEYAEQAAGPMVQVWVNVATFGLDERARSDAAQKVIDLAFKGAGEQTDSGATLEADWWAAASNEQD